MKRRRRCNKQKKLIIFGLLIIITGLSIGYASFSTNLNLSVKGNITNTPEKCFAVSDNGDGTGTITDYDETCGSTVKIPNQINNLIITKVGDGNEINGIHGPFVSKQIKKLILPNTLTYIGSHAFVFNPIAFLEIPSSVKVIADHAFAWSDAFSNGLVLHEGLETIGMGAFESNKLTHLKIPSTVKNMYSTIASANYLEGDNAFIYSRDENGKIDNTNLVTFGDRSRKEVIIPQNIKTLNSASFVGAYNLEKITIPDSVITVQGWTFWHMPNLKEVNIGSGIVNMDGSTFNDVPNLTTININKKENAIEGAPWGATNAKVNWTG